MDSLFYIKTKISDECEINTSITSENVYTICGDCGEENKVDLTDWTDLIEENGIDGFGCTLFCEKCSKKRRSKEE